MVESFDNPLQKHLEELVTADPETAEIVTDRINEKHLRPSPDVIRQLVEDTIWGLSHEYSFGRTIAKGYLSLIPTADSDVLHKYKAEIRKAGRVGPTLGGLIALFWPPVLKTKDPHLLELFEDTTETMLTKGTYTLKPPLSLLTELIESQEFEAAVEYLQILNLIFKNDLTYNRARHYSETVPRAIEALPRAKRFWQIQQLAVIIRLDLDLTDSLIEGFEQGLYLLTHIALMQYIETGIDKYHHRPQTGKNFLALASKEGRDLFQHLQVNVSVGHMLPVLNRYVQARTGLRLTVRPMPADTHTGPGTQAMPFYVYSDGRHIYLKDEIDDFPTQAENTRLLKGLLRLETAQYEFQTFDFDLEKLLPGIDQPPECFQKNQLNQRQSAPDPDMVLFWQCFPDQKLAEHLMTIFEHGRLRLKLKRHYPGLLRETYPLLKQKVFKQLKNERPPSTLLILYCLIALEESLPQDFDWGTIDSASIKSICADFKAYVTEESSVSDCAQMVLSAYPRLQLQITANNDTPDLNTPYGIKLRPNLYHKTDLKNDLLARQLKKALAKQKIHIFKSDLKKRVHWESGRINLENIENLAIGIDPENGVSAEGTRQIIIDTIHTELAKRFDHPVFNAFDHKTGNGPIFRYKEWDADLGDYLHQHVIVRNREVNGSSSAFYNHTLQKYSGLVKSIRYSFELLKPEGLKLLRRRREGDHFDYRALLDFAIDRKVGIMPSDRLYIKHLKQERDVGVLLLVDLSRSTVNLVPGTDQTVLDVEKEAIVLFCEALEVLGDTYAVAGFSGNGRLGVDFYPIKDFSEPLGDATRRKISAMSSKRSTRMGAAIRHAGVILGQSATRVKLLIIIGDGFPNDVGYKKTYAVQDTRKSILEALSGNIFVHAITVNVAGDTPLDDLYGKAHHDIISDVRELPNKLLGLYSSLTKK